VIVLDTHVLLWLDQEVGLLGAKARALADYALTEGGLAVSAISFCEIAALVTRAKFVLRLPVQEWRQDLLDRGVSELAVDGQIAIDAVLLPALHRDPADRLIVATALATEAVLLTADERILAWPGPLDRIDARL
jgi:PIN domain nuclease of toxin-antitoxin system